MMPNPFAGKPLKGTMNPFKKGFWSNNALLSPVNVSTAGVRNLVGAGFKGGGASVGDDIYKPLTPGGKDKVKTDAEAAEATARADAAAAEKQAMFDASTKEGLERLALKRKRGFGASVLVQPTTSAFGSGSTFGS